MRTGACSWRERRPGGRQAECPFRLPAIRLGVLAALVLLSYGGFRAAGGRLIPMVIAHWIINLLFGVIPQIVVGIILLSG